MSKKPRYILVKEDIERRIREQELMPGEKLASEPLLAQQYEVSRPTLREALKMLQREGILISKNGVGTYVNQKSEYILHPLSKLQSLGEMIKNVGYQESETDVVVYQAEATDEWREKLQLQLGEQVTVLERIRMANGHKVAFYYNVFPEKIIQQAKIDEKFSGAIFEFLEQQLHISITYALTEICAVSRHSEMDKKALERLGDEILLLKQLHYDEHDQPIFYSIDYLKTEVFKLLIKRE